MVSGTSRALVCLTGFIVSILIPSVASACRVPARPDVVRTFKADSILLVKVVDSRLGPSSHDWTATGAVEGQVFGSYPKSRFSFSNEGVISCRSMGQPQRDRHYVLYLERSRDDFNYVAGFPFWFARASGDPRLAKLNRLKPLGLARKPDADAKQWIDLVEPRVREQSGKADLFGYTQVYGRSSASSISVMLIPSRSSRRLMVNDTSEFPTAESCRCRPIELSIQVDDLLAAGKLPPFDP